MASHSIQRQDSPHRPTARMNHAIVLGGSIAGLLSARVLSSYAERVTVLERDEAPHGDALRKGVPQARHAHLLLQSGLDALRGLFPAIDADFARAAGPAFDVVAETSWKIEGLYRPRFRSDLQAYALGRPALEAIVRARVSALPNVQISYATRATGLLLEQGRVVGVRLGQGGVLEAQLVVDASGRASRCMQWLKELGFAPPTVERAQLDLSYVSCTVRLRGGLPRGGRMLLVPPRPPGHPVGALLVPVRDGRHVLTLIAYDGASPPRSLHALRERLKQVDEPSLCALFDTMTVESELASFAIPQQEWRRYDRCRSLPGGLLVLGDALCNFDPGFGQGMSVSALQAAQLDALLADTQVPLEQLPRRFFQRTACLIATPWSLARARPVDLERPAGGPVQRWLRAYRRSFMRAAADSVRLHGAFVRVVNLEQSPSSLVHPALALRVLLHALRTAASRWLVRTPRPSLTTSSDGS